MNKICKWIVCLGTLLIWAIKFVIRPFIDIPFYLQFFLNVAPNLIGCILIPFAAFWWFKRFYTTQNNKETQVFCLLGLCMVIINEYVQLIPLFKRTFDYLDIASSIVGVFIGYYVFTTLKQRFTVAVQ